MATSSSKARAPRDARETHLLHIFRWLLELQTAIDEAAHWPPSETPVLPRLLDLIQDRTPWTEAALWRVDTGMVVARATSAAQTAGLMSTRAPAIDAALRAGGVSIESGGLLVLPLTGRARPAGAFTALTTMSPGVPPAALGSLRASGRALEILMAREPRPTGAASVSRRELEVLRRASDGGTSASIAAAMGVSPATVKSHFESLYAKLGAHDRAHAVAAALRAGLID